MIQFKHLAPAMKYVLKHGGKLSTQYKDGVLFYVVTAFKTKEISR